MQCRFGDAFTCIDVADVAGLQSALDLKAPRHSPAFTGTVLGLSISMVGLGNVDNTSDKDKPLSDTTLGMFTTISGEFDIRVAKNRQISPDLHGYRAMHH